MRLDDKVSQDRSPLDINPKEGDNDISQDVAQ